MVVISQPVKSRSLGEIEKARDVVTGNCSLSDLEDQLPTIQDALNELIIRRHVIDSLKMAGGLPSNSRNYTQEYVPAFSKGGDSDGIDPVNELCPICDIDYWVQKCGRFEGEIRKLRAAKTAHRKSHKT